MTFSKQFIEIMDDLAKRFGIIVDWSSNNVIPYLQGLSTRIINYEIYTSLTWMVMVLILGIPLSIISYKKYNKTLALKEKEGTRRYDDLLGGCMIVFVISSLAVLLVTGSEVFDIVEALTLPEKTIFDFIQYNTDFLN